MYKIFIEGIDIVAWLLIIYSYYKENTNKILLVQIISTILFCIYYLLLGGYSGLFICLFEVIMDYGYFKTDKDLYIFLGSVPIYLGMLFYNTKGIMSLSLLIDSLPIISSMTERVTLLGRKRIVVIGAIISYSLWVIYDISIEGYSGAITDGIVALSNIYILISGKDLELKRSRLLGRKLRYKF